MATAVVGAAMKMDSARASTATVVTHRGSRKKADADARRPTHKYRLAAKTSLAANFPPRPQ